MRYRNTAWAGLLASIVLSLFSCADRQQGAALADAGVKASASLSDFYGSLIADVNESTELEAYEGSLRGTPVSEAELKVLNQTATALRARQEVSVAMKSAYTSLKNLSSYDAAGELKKAAASLATSVEGLPMLPASHVDPSALIGDVAGEIAAAKQNHDIVRAAKILQKEIAAIDKLFRSEEPQYQSTIAERGNKVIVVADGLVDLGYLGTAALLEEVPTTLGLEWTGPKEMPGNTTHEAVKQLMHTRVIRFNNAALAATQAEAQVLAQLRQTQSALIAKESTVNMDDISMWIAKANAYLDDIQKLRKPSNATPKENL